MAVESISGGFRGSRPTPPTEAKGPSRTRLVFELDAQDADLVRAALAMVRASANLQADDLSDGAVLADLARRALHDAKPEHAPSAERYRTVLVHCERCGDTTGLHDEIGDSHVGHAACDGEVQEARPGRKQGHLSRVIPPATRRAVLFRDGYRCTVPGCRCDVWIDVHHLQERHRGGDHHPDNLTTLCCAHHRLVHDGRMAIRRTAHGIEVELDGGRVLRRPAPRPSDRALRSSATSA